MTKFARVRARYLRLCQEANLADDPDTYTNAAAYAFGYLRAIDDILGRDKAQAVVEAAQARIVDAPSVRGIMPVELAMDGQRSRFVLDVKTEHVH